MSRSIRGVAIALCVTGSVATVGAPGHAATRAKSLRLKLSEVLSLPMSLSQTAPLTETKSCPRAMPQAVTPDFDITQGGTFGFITLDGFKAGSSRRFQISVGPLFATGPQQVLMGALCAGGKAKLVHVRGNGSVGPMQDGGGTVTCPARAPHALSGFFAPTAPSQLGQLLLTGSYPINSKGRAWGFDIENASVNTVPFTATVTCAPASVKVEYLETDNVSAAPGKDSGAGERCDGKKLHRAVSGYFGPQTKDDNGALAVDTFSPAGIHAWTEGVRNVASGPKRAFFGVVCVQ